MAKMTVHFADSPRESWLEVDVGGRKERVEGVQAVEVTLIDGKPYGCAVAFSGRPSIEVHDERASIEDS